jgi:hypothetical protein
MGESCVSNAFEAMGQRIACELLPIQRTPDEARDFEIFAFQNVLHCSASPASEGLLNCIEATRPGMDNMMNASLHWSIEGCRQYIEGDEDGLLRNARLLVVHFRHLGAYGRPRRRLRAATMGQEAVRQGKGRPRVSASAQPRPPCPPPPARRRIPAPLL